MQDIGQKYPPETLHQQMLNFFVLHLRRCCDILEAHVAVVSSTLECRVNEGHEADLLLHKRVVLLQDGLDSSIDNKTDT